MSGKKRSVKLPLFRKIYRHRVGLYLNLNKLTDYTGYVLIEEFNEDDNYIIIKMKKLRSMEANI
ncbi:MAG: hypothetical protein MRT15_11705 [archaeon YNP-LCB-003-016]|uniref:hypothetical protein n=1 Tax=Candidatus Culexarchaeum yellowstonense TaxID=2928963 RepID=UPI0026F2AFC3|nr:hypothetical protein [Candidatus Culexarchaeum yellowstonense]MCR6693050.1 hypothetical protein [Candidatus Culexarchaeum yellowstonense]